MLALGFVSGLLFGPVNPVINVVMQERSPERMRGRVLGVFTSSAYAAGPLGLLLAGPLVDHLGVKGAFMTLALALTVVGLATIALPDLRDLDRPSLPVPAPSRSSTPSRSAGAGRATASRRRVVRTGHPAGRHDAPTPTATPTPRPRRSGRRSARRGARRHRGGSTAP